jgi:hypothetical protein
MAGTRTPLHARPPEPEILPSIRDGIIARWSGAGIFRRGSRIDAAIDVGGNQIILTGTAPTADDRDEAVALAAVDSLGMLIVDRIQLPTTVSADQDC